MEYITHEHKLKDGDVIVRIYPENHEAIGIYTSRYIRKFCYFGETFDKYGGLREFGSYSLGLSSKDYKYRYGTYQEAEKIINKYGDKIPSVINGVIKYKNRLRKEKLNRLKQLNILKQLNK